MTDRYYPKGLVPSYPLTCTYQDLNKMETHPRSQNIPGSSVHQHGTKAKFGYATPAPDPTPSPPIDPNDPMVNFAAGDPIATTSLPNKPLSLDAVPAKKTEKPDLPFASTLGAIEQQKAPLNGTDARTGNFTFTAQTSQYLVSTKGNRAIQVDSDCTYMPSIGGRGTGYNSDSTNVSWWPEGNLAKGTTTKDAYPVPVTKRDGLASLAYTVNLEA